MQRETEKRNETKWIDVNTIQKEFLPVSKKKIRVMLKNNLDVTYVGKKMLVEKSQLIAYLRREI